MCLLCSLWLFAVGSEKSQKLDKKLSSYIVQDNEEEEKSGLQQQDVFIIRESESIDETLEREVLENAEVSSEFDRLDWL